MRKMCNDCVVEEFPDRESMCVDEGSYLVNFEKCSECGAKDVKTLNKSVTDSGDEELTWYQHICSQCEHVIAEHEHVFKVEGEFQIYEMACLLCGNGEDQRSILPVDPRGPQM